MKSEKGQWLVLALIGGFILWLLWDIRKSTRRNNELLAETLHEIKRLATPVYITPAATLPAPAKSGMSLWQLMRLLLDLCRWFMAGLCVAGVVAV